MEKIFVQIPCYRDPECQQTLKDMFEKASHPARVFAGVCWVLNEREDGDCRKEIHGFPGQVRNVYFSAEEELGINWARQQAQTLWQGEDYILCIHAHMRFEKGWDEILISQLKRAPGRKPVLSTCPPGYVAPDEFPYRDETKASFATVYKVDPSDPQILGVAGKLIHKDTNIPYQMHSPFAVGSFMFARSEMMLEVPFDPHLYYYNSELAYSARLWTHGYDIVQPDAYAVYHWYGRTYATPRPYRDIHNPRHADSLMRLKHLLRLELADRSAVISEIERYGLGNARRIEDFWTFSGIHPQRPYIPDFAGRGMWDDTFLQVMKHYARPAPKQPTIFVQIASYRDAECQWTVKDIFEKAAHPDRIVIGICWQYDPDEDQDCFKVSVRPDQVRIAPFHWSESQGVCWARHQAQQLYGNEDYVLMIDSHMRFVFGWDEKLIGQLALCKSPKPVLSNHPASYMPPHELEHNPGPTALCVLPFTDTGDIRVSGGFMRRKPPYPLLGAFVAGGFIFAGGSIIRDVPYDPYMYFNQEEMSLSARLFTHGWDVYSPNEVLAYHCYNVGEHAKKRPLHWTDNEAWSKLQKTAKQRFDHLLDHTPTDDPQVLRDLMLYGLGDVRTLAQFEEFAGIDFKKRVASDKALNYGITDEMTSYMRESAPMLVKPNPQGGGAKVTAFPDPAQACALPYNFMQLANGDQRQLNVDTSAPKDVLLIYDYIEKELCQSLARYADSQTFTDLTVVDYNQTTKDKVVTVKNEGRITNHVEIDGMAGDVLSIFNDIYCNRMAPFYNVNFEWYERPQILRYPAGGKYNQHADADHWLPEKNEWVRVQDRDYSVLLYLNDEYEGGEIHFVHQNFKMKPRPGMLLAFPSDHRFLHAALPTTSGIRYVMVSWAAALGTRRVRPQPPYASVFVRQKRAKAP